MFEQSSKEVTTPSKESGNRRLWVEQSIGVLGKSTPDKEMDHVKDFWRSSLDSRKWGL